MRLPPILSLTSFAALFSMTISVAADTTPAPLSLHDCIDLALVRNLRHLSERRDVERVRAQLSAAQSPFELNANADFTLPSYNEQRDTFDDVALLSRIREESTNYRYEGRVVLSQRVRNLGEFSISSGGIRTQVNSNRRQDFLDYTGNVRFGYSQDLLATSDEEIRVKQAELSFSRSRSNLDRQQLFLEAEVTSSYYNLVESIRRLDIEKQQLEQAEASHVLAQRKYEIGLIAEVETLRLLVAKLNAEASYAGAETVIERRRDELRQVLGMEMTVPLEVDTTVTYEHIPIDEALAIEVGLRQRTDLRDTEIRQHLDKLELEQIGKRLGPSAVLNVGATLQGRGADLEYIPQNFERSLVSARIDLRMPLLDGGDRRGAVRQAEIALEQSQLSEEMQRQQIIREIRNSVRDAGQTERQIEIRRTALEVAERQHQVEDARFQLGIGDSQELLDAQTSVTSARIAHLTSIINYQRALGELRVTTMADLSQLVADTDQ